MLTRAASSARLRPEDTPTPSIAVPLLHMIAFTSAKSTFTRPGMVMMSLMPWTPCSAVLHRCLVWGTQQVTAATLRHECSDVTHLHPPDFRGGLPFPHIDHAPGCQQKSLSLARQEPALWGRRCTCSRTWRSTSSASRKASCSGVLLPTTSSSLQGAQSRLGVSQLWS